MSETPPARTIKIRIRIPDRAVPAQAAVLRTAPENARPLRFIVSILALFLGVTALVLLRAPETPPPEPSAEVATLGSASPPETALPVTGITESHPAGPVPASVAVPGNENNGGRNRVIRALLTDSLRGQQPDAALGTEIPAADKTVRFYFFTEVGQPTGKSYAHVWEYNGKVAARIPFNPRSDPWRASSNKRIPTHLQGQWRAVLVDEHGNELASTGFTYGTGKK